MVVRVNVVLNRTVVVDSDSFKVKVSCITLESWFTKGMRPNIGREPDHGKRTPLIFRLIGIGTDLYAPVAVSDYDKSFADSIGAG